MKPLSFFSSFLRRKTETSPDIQTSRDTPICPDTPACSEPQHHAFTAISDTLAEDIFIVGYPKSGNTWMQNLVAGILYCMDMRFVPDSLVQDLVPDVHATRFFNRHRTPTFFKTHHLPRPEYKRVIYLVRDGRDAIVSYYHFLCALQEQPVQFLDLVTSGNTLFPSKWHEHVEAWLKNPYQADMMILKYEDLKREPLRELRRLCDFAGIARDDSFLTNVANQSSFEEMRLREKTLGLAAASPWPKDKSFVRRGKVGSHLDEMPPDVLAKFLEISLPMLRELGYSQESAS